MDDAEQMKTTAFAECPPHRNELTFQNLRYIITVFSTPADVLVIEAEQKSDGARWRASFSSRHIEDMTQRIGSFKKFPIFVKMLNSAILQDSDSVFVDLLTYQDLEDLKYRKTHNSDRVKRAINSDKRYLILTYVGEFDRIHYPLPLAHDENLEPDVLRRTIKRLRIEVDCLKKQLHIFQLEGTCQERIDTVINSENEEHEMLRKENYRLLTQLRCLEDAMIQHLGYKGDSNTSDNDKKKIASDLSRYRKKCSVLLSKLEAKMMSQKDVQGLEGQLERLQTSLKLEKEKREKLVANLTREKIALADQVRLAQESERRMLFQFREMERELDRLKRRLKLQGESNITNSYSRIRTNSRTLSHKTTPYSSRENSPFHISYNKSSSRASSCPTFHSINSCNSSPKEEVKLPIYKEYLRRKPSSPLSSSGLRDSPKHSMKSKDRFSITPPKHSISPCRRSKENENILHTPPENSTFSRTPFNRSTRHTWMKSDGRHCRTDSNVSNSFISTGGENQSDCGSRTSSPKKLLQEVKAKLAEYARLQEVHLQ